MVSYVCFYSVFMDTKGDFLSARFFSLKEEQSDVQLVLAGLVISLLQYSTYSFYLDLSFLPFMLIAEYLHLCGYVSLTGVQAISDHGFNGESSSEKKEAYDILESKRLAKFRDREEFHAGIRRSCCLATGLKAAPCHHTAEIRGDVSRNTKPHLLQRLSAIKPMYLLPA